MSLAGVGNLVFFLLIFLLCKYLIRGPFMGIMSNYFDGGIKKSCLILKGDATHAINNFIIGNM